MLISYFEVCTWYLVVFNNENPKVLKFPSKLIPVQACFALCGVTALNVTTTRYSSSSCALRVARCRVIYIRTRTTYRYDCGTLLLLNVATILIYAR